MSSNRFLKYDINSKSSKTKAQQYLDSRSEINNFMFRDEDVIEDNTKYVRIRFDVFRAKGDNKDDGASDYSLWSEDDSSESEDDEENDDK